LGSRIWERVRRFLKRKGAGILPGNAGDLVHAQAWEYRSKRGKRGSPLLKKAATSASPAKGYSGDQNGRDEPEVGRIPVRERFSGFKRERRGRSGTTDLGRMYRGDSGDTVLGSTLGKKRGHRTRSPREER